MKREDFSNMLQKKEKNMVVFFTATWCKPCQKVKPRILELSSQYDIDFVQLDYDHDSDVYSLLKSKKQVNGVPSLLAYKKSNVSPIADFGISGSNSNEIDCFFESIEFL